MQVSQKRIQIYLKRGKDTTVIGRGSPLQSCFSNSLDTQQNDSYERGTCPLAPPLNPPMCELVQTLSLTAGKHEYGLNFILIAAYVVKMYLIEN